MRPFLEKKIAAKVAPVLGQPLTATGTLPLVAPELTNEGLLQRFQQMGTDFGVFVEQATTIMSRQQSTITTQSGLLQQMATMMEQLTQRLQSIAGNEAVAATMQQLYQTLQQNLAGDKTTAADVLNTKQALQQIQQQLPTFATATDVAAGLLGKANASTVQTISTKLNTTADGLANVQSALPTLATTSALTTATATVQSAVDTQKGRVDALVSTTVPAVQAAIDTQKGRVDTIVTTTVPALQTDIDKRLKRDGDTATAQINGPVADATTAGRTAYPQFNQVLGGINQPVRLAQNVGSTTVALDAYNDPTGLNRMLIPRNINFLMDAMPPTSLLGSITLKVGTTPGGSEVYSKNISTSALSGLLGVLKAPEPPTNTVRITAGSSLYVTVTPSSGTNAGRWTAIVDAVFIPNAS